MAAYRCVDTNPLLLLRQNQLIERIPHTVQLLELVIRGLRSYCHGQYTGDSVNIMGSKLGEENTLNSRAKQETGTH